MTSNEAIRQFDPVARRWETERLTEVIMLLDLALESSVGIDDDDLITRVSTARDHARGRLAVLRAGTD